MDIKSGSVIVVDGHSLVVTCIRTQETIEGRAISLTAMDQESARKSQLEVLNQEHLSDDTANMLRGFMGKMKQELPEMFKTPPSDEGI